MEYFCSYCGAILNYQDGFDPDKGIWICTRCGGILHGQQSSMNFFEDIDWFCDKCGAYLNTQEGFTDFEETWTCKECGYENAITEEHIDYEAGTPMPKSTEFSRYKN